MAFNKYMLKQQGNRMGEHTTLFTYKSQDAIATVNTEGYFNDSHDILRPGDTIFVTQVTDAGVISAQHIVVVLTITAGVVDVSDGTAIAVTDGD